MKLMNAVRMTAALLLVALVAVTAGSAQMTKTIVNARAFANDSTYTAGPLEGWGKANRITTYLSCTDTINVKVISEYKTPDAASWSQADTTTINVNSSTGTTVETVYRSNTAEILPGIHRSYRFRYIFQSSGNGLAGTRKYTVVAWSTN